MVVRGRYRSGVAVGEVIPLLCFGLVRLCVAAVDRLSGARVQGTLVLTEQPCILPFALCILPKVIYNGHQDHFTSLKANIYGAHIK